MKGTIVKHLAGLKILIVFGFLANLLACIAKAPSQLHASQEFPLCGHQAIDPDHDGWGWENNRSCRMAPICSTTRDLRGDGWAEEQGRRCRVIDYCSLPGSDPDHDGFGWENQRSCRMPATCKNRTSDPDGDGWGWENGQSCRQKDAPQTGRPSPNKYLALEEKSLSKHVASSPPTKAELAALIKEGLPKPANDKPRALKAHNQLMRWSHDIIVLAFQLKLQNAEQQHATLRDLKNRLAVFVAVGSNYGDHKDTANYGNLPLELIWTMGNLIRAAHIATNIGAELGADSPWQPEDKAQFQAWAEIMAKRYFVPEAFNGNLSNRAASQFETLMRLAALSGNHEQLKKYYNSLINLIDRSILSNGAIKDDAPRDKYHAQFFLASALQALQLAKRSGLEALPTSTAKKLSDAIAYSALVNTQNDLPKEYPNVIAAKPNYEIPFWYLVPLFCRDYGIEQTAAMAKMLEENYQQPSRYDFAMNWGFNAYAVHYEL